MEKLEIKNILNKKYDRENWKNLSHQIFEKVEYFKEPIKIDHLNEKVLEFLQIGNIKLNDNKKIALFEIKLIKNLNIYKNKVELRNLVINYIDQVANHGVLVVYDNQGDNYRLTFSTKYSEILDDGKLVKLETEPKRYTYLLGETESCSTAAERLYLLSTKKRSLYLDDIIDAFNVEKVSQEFFDNYKNLSLEIQSDLKNLRKKDKKIDQDFRENNLDEINFSKKLLGQIVFIYFLQKKGWLGIEKNEAGDYRNWGQGDKLFFKNLFNKKYKNYNNFFNDLLEPLFYEGFGSERKDDVFSLLSCKIPFLNGGLFEPIKNYDWSQTNITLSNEIFEKIIEIFDRYNFTVQEEDPEEREIAIDPEMLGKVFENLLPENIRKQGGSFYTPRSVVKYICEESIVHYLNEKLNGKIDTKIVYKFVTEKKDQNKEIHKEIIQNASLIDEYLKNIKICDPAIGSGAFPVSIMNLIVSLRHSLTPKIDRKYKNTNYYFKKDCIQNSLYGVDIEESAVEIAKLRLWLSLVVEEDDYEKIEPLPNLDFKIVQGNSLLETFENYKLGDTVFENKVKETFEDYIGNNATEESLKELAKIQSSFFKTVSHNKKKELKIKIEQKIIEIFKENILQRQNFTNEKKSEVQIKLNEFLSDKVIKNFFPWKIYFSEVFTFNGGFDLVIGNPPYVSVKDVNKFDWKKNLENNFGFLDDLYNHFTFLGFLISKKNGIISYITSDTFMTLQSKSLLRKKLLDNQILNITPTSKAFSAMVDTCIFLVKNIENKDNYTFDFLDLKSSKILDENDLKTFSKPNWEILLDYIFSDVKNNKAKKSISSDLFKNNLNYVFFSPSEKNLRINQLIIPKLNKLYKTYWEAIKTSKAIKENYKLLNEYNDKLKFNDLTMLGMITQGGQGLATGNNGDFVGCKNGTSEAIRVSEQRPKKLFDVIKKYNSKVFKIFPELKNIKTKQNIEEFLKNKSEKKIREYFFELKKTFGRDVFGQGFLYKIILDEEILDISEISNVEKLNGVKNLKKNYIKYDKGDKDGNRWFNNTSFYIKWDKVSVQNYKSSSLARWQGYDFYFKTGFSWSDVHTVYLKSRIKEETIHDVTSMSLTSINKLVSDEYVVCLINSKFIAEFQENFLNNTSHFQINDARKMPVIIPDKKTKSQFESIFSKALEIKKKFFDKKITFDQHEFELKKIEDLNDKMVESLYLKSKI